MLIGIEKRMAAGSFVASVMIEGGLGWIFENAVSIFYESSSSKYVHKKNSALERSSIEWVTNVYYVLLL